MCSFLPSVLYFGTVSCQMVYCSLTEFQSAVYKAVLETEDVLLVLRAQEPCSCNSGHKRKNCCYKVRIFLYMYFQILHQFWLYRAVLVLLRKTPFLPAWFLPLPFCSLASSLLVTELPSALGGGARCWGNKRSGCGSIQRGREDFSGDGERRMNNFQHFQPKA